ncbi:hypothetical protein KIN20_024420 [Parelaphostrongylus tenuis]|uniref:Uncharacterized protein n=1 Tax=Parelaphostrongylus tenuis TaxID=148309 RepID=A0AAD5NB47_PARTN|nr:hypothetical protein KIN20_024420 [Parelaphostrongylus tenuis]
MLTPYYEQTLKSQFDSNNNRGEDPQREPAIVDNWLKSLPLERKDVELDYVKKLIDAEHSCACQLVRCES